MFGSMFFQITSSHGGRPTGAVFDVGSLERGVLGRRLLQWPQAQREGLAWPTSRPIPGRWPGLEPRTVRSGPVVFQASSGRRFRLIHYLYWRVCFLKHSLCVLGSSYLLDCAKFSLMCVFKEMKVINQTLLCVSLHFVEIYLQGLRNSNILKPMLTFKARWKRKWCKSCDLTFIKRSILRRVNFRNGRCRPKNLVESHSAGLSRL